MKKILILAVIIGIAVACSDKKEIAPISWEKIENNNLNPLSSVWEIDDKWFIAGGSLGVEADEHLGIILSYNGQTINIEKNDWNSRAIIKGIAGIDDMIYAIGQTYGTQQELNDILLQYDGTSWQDVSNESFYDFHNIKVIDDEIYITASHAIYRLENNQLLPIFSFNFHCYDIWGGSANDLYAVGFSGEKDYIFHYDGISWTNMIENSNFSGSFLNAIEGIAEDEIYAIGNNILLKFDGEEWSIVEGNVSGFRDLTIVGTKDVYLVTGEHPSSGGIYHYDGNTLSEEYVIDTEINGIWSRSEQGIIVVGNNGLIMKKDIKR